MITAKKTLALLLLLCTSPILKAQQSGIAFTSATWHQALALAKKEDRPIFLFGSTPWCHFCKNMQSKVFPDKTVADYYNSTFINIELNFEKTPGDSLAREYGIASYPSYLFFDKKGNLLHISSGEKGAGEFIQTGKNAFIEDSAYAFLKTRFENGDRAPGLLYSYSNALMSTVTLNQLQSEVEKLYLQSQDSSALQSKHNLSYILEHAASMQSPATEYFFRLYNKLTATFGAPVVKRSSMFLISSEANDAGVENNIKKLNALKNTLSSYTRSQATQLNALADVKFAMGIFIKDKSKWDQYAGATSGYARSYINNDTYTIYEAATYLFTFGNDPKILPAITKLMEQVVTVNKTYDHYLLLAKIYYKMGQQDKAAAQADKAIASGIDKGVNTDDAEALLAEARKGK